MATFLGALNKMKPFKTHNQQLKILRDRGLEVPSEKKRDLENENYYNIINGYKDLFLCIDSRGLPEVPEKFIEGTHFDEVFSLYKLDVLCVIIHFILRPTFPSRLCPYIMRLLFAPPSPL